MRHRDGFTLVELLIAMTISVVILLAVTTFMVQFLQDNTAARVRSDLLADAQQTLDLIGEDVRLSSSADEHNRWPDSYAPGAPVDTLSWESDSDTLVLGLIAQTEAGDPIFSDAAQYITEKNSVVYFVEDSVLYRRMLPASVTGNEAVLTCPEAVVECAADRVMARNVTEFSIRYLDGTDAPITPPEARSVEVTLGLSTQRSGQTISAEYTARTVFRNG